MKIATSVRHALQAGNANMIPPDWSPSEHKPHTRAVPTRNSATHALLGSSAAQPKQTPGVNVNRGVVFHVGISIERLWRARLPS